MSWTRSHWLELFYSLKPFLEEQVEAGELLYVYTNGYVLPNVPDIEGGILNNNAALCYETWMMEHNYGKMLTPEIRQKYRQREYFLLNLSDDRIRDRVRMIPFEEYVANHGLLSVSAENLVKHGWELPEHLYAWLVNCDDGIYRYSWS